MQSFINLVRWTLTTTQKTDKCNRKISNFENIHISFNLEQCSSGRYFYHYSELHVVALWLTFKPAFHYDGVLMRERTGCGSGW